MTSITLNIFIYESIFLYITIFQFCHYLLHHQDSLTLPGSWHSVPSHHTCGHLLTHFFSDILYQETHSHCMDSFSSLVLQNPTLVHCIPPPTMLSRDTYFVLLHLIYGFRMELLEKGRGREEDSSFILQCSYCYTTNESTHLSLLFQDNNFYSGYVCVSYVYGTIEKLWGSIKLAKKGYFPHQKADHDPSPA